MGYLYIDNTTQWGGVKVCANLRTHFRMGWGRYILTTLLSGEGLRYVQTLY